jgi:uncharacterized protein (TIGR03435 family)
MAFRFLTRWKKQLAEMLHGLPLDGFELRTHTENREVTVYALTVGRAQPRLTRADDAEDSSRPQT